VVIAFTLDLIFVFGQFKIWTTLAKKNEISFYFFTKKTRQKPGFLRKEKPARSVRLSGIGHFCFDAIGFCNGQIHNSVTAAVELVQIGLQKTK